jgi:hypothetical protein
LRVGVVTGSPGAVRVRPHAELSSLDVVSVLFFDTPALTRTDPPAVAVAPALSPVPEDQAPPSPAVPTAAAEPLPVDAALKQTGVPEGAAGEGVAQAQQ